MARLVLPSRLELKRPEGSSNEAPLAKVIFTTFLYVSPVQMIPACDHTGTPLHFHSSITSGSASLMRVRTRASVSPRQSLSSLILASISREGDSPPFSSFAPLLLFFMAVPFFMVVVARPSLGYRSSAFGLRACGLMTWRPLAPRTHVATSRSHSFAGQLAGLAHPSGELSFIELVVLMDVEVARVLARGLAGRDRTQRCAAEESHFDGFREGMNAEEPAVALDPVKRRVPFDRLAHAGGGAHDQRVEAAPDVAFPPRHGRDVGLHGGVAGGLRDLGIAACEEGRLRGLAGPRLRCCLARFGRLCSDPLGGGRLCDLRRRHGRPFGHCVHSN